MKVWVRAFDVSGTGGFGAWIAGTPTGETRISGQHHELHREIVLPAEKTIFWWPTAPAYSRSIAGEVAGVVYLSRNAVPLGIFVQVSDLPPSPQMGEFRWGCQAPTQRLPTCVTP